MPTIRQIAQDPHNTLKDLEKELGSEPGALLEDMARLAGTGDGWKNHLPYLIAESYYEDEAARAQYQGHVDACEYCKTLLQTLHPSDPQARDFAEQATAAQRTVQGGSARRSVPAYSIPFAVAASIALTAIAVPALQQAGTLRSSVRGKQLVVNSLRMEPSALMRLERSDKPVERFRAAQYYFAVEQPQLAYRQIGQGLQLAGFNESDTSKITTAADIPSDKSAATISNAAQRLPNLEAAAATKDPTDYLEVAEAQAKLGLHNEALKSIQKYLKARNIDPQTLAEFSDVALATPSAAVDVATR